MNRKTAELSTRIECIVEGANGQDFDPSKAKNCFAAALGTIAALPLLARQENATRGIDDMFETTSTVYANMSEQQMTPEMLMEVLTMAMHRAPLEQSVKVIEVLQELAQTD